MPINFNHSYEMGKKSLKDIHQKVHSRRNEPNDSIPIKASAFVVNNLFREKTSVQMASLENAVKYLSKKYC